MKLCEAVITASKLEKAYIREVRQDDGGTKTLVLVGDFLYLSSGYKHKAWSPFIPSVWDYASEWIVD